MRTNSKNRLNKPNDVIVFDIPEASVTDRGRAKKLRYLKRAKGVTHVGSVPSYWDSGKLIILKDDLGRDALSFLAEQGIRSDYVSVLRGKRTGECLVTLDGQGIPRYDLLSGVAYDEIPAPDLSGEDFDAFYFGSLALRSQKNRETVSEVLASRDFKEVFVDINVRPPFISADVIRFAFQNATVLKISEEETPAVTKLLFGWERDAAESVKTIADTFRNVKIILITKGANGSVAYDCKSGRSVFCEAVKVKVASTVGAGDSFSAAFLYGYLSGRPIEDCLCSASRISSFVCSKPQAIPPYPHDFAE